MSDVACPNCRGVMSSPTELTGKWVACPFCHQQFVLPNQKQIIVAPAPSHDTALRYAAASQGYTRPTDLLSGIRTPILVSAIVNTIGAVLYTLFCITVFLAVPLAILCIFEYCYYSNSLRMPPQRAIQEGRTIAIIEIVAGALTLNVIVITCGILALVMANQAEQRLLAANQQFTSA